MSRNATVLMEASGDTVGILVRVEGFSFEARFKRTSLDRGTLNVSHIRVDGFEHRMTGEQHCAAIRELSGPGEGRSEAMDALKGLIPPGTAELALAQPRALRHDLAFYCGDRRTGPARRALAIASPGIACVLPTVANRLSLNHSRTLDGAEALLHAYAPGASRASVRRVLACDPPVPHSDVLDAMLAVPTDWIPAGEAERAAFDDVALCAGRLADLLGDHGPLSSSRGRWAEFQARLGTTVTAHPAGGRHLIEACRNAEDAVRALSAEVVLPALVASGRLGDEAAFDPFGHMLALPPGGDAPMTGIALAARLLFGGKSLPAILEASAAWHSRKAAMDAALAANAQAHGADEVGHGTWPVPFPPATAPNGVEIRFLSSKAELVEEGAAMSHCVGGYADRCGAGSLSIASLRVPGDGGFARLSTAAVEVGARGAKAGQHSGMRNASPPEAAKDALGWFLGRIASGEVEPSPEYLSPGWRRSGAGKRSVRGECGYDPRSPGAWEGALAVWAPLLPRPLRDPAAFLAATEALLPPAPPPPGLARRTRALVARHPTASTWAATALLAVAIPATGHGVAISDAICMGVAFFLAVAIPSGLWAIAAFAATDRQWFAFLSMSWTALSAAFIAPRGVTFALGSADGTWAIPWANAALMALPWVLIAGDKARTMSVAAFHRGRAARYNARRRRQPAVAGSRT